MEKSFYFCGVLPPCRPWAAIGCVALPGSGAALPVNPLKTVARALSILFFFLLAALTAAAQTVSGTVTDARTGELLPFVNVAYDKTAATQTDVSGRYSVPFRPGKLRFSCIGYATRSVSVKSAGRIDVKLESNESSFSEAVVTGRREKYSRKNNPAVELMRKVIAAKQKTDLHSRDYFSMDKYSKLTFAFNEVTEKVFQEGKFKRMPFLREHVEVCNETGKLILPISVEETTSRELYRRHPSTEKSIVTGHRNVGVNSLFNTGDILTAMLRDVFTDVDIYDNDIRLFQHYFTSPLSSRSAISFYRYFIIDTLQVGPDRCIRVDFTPNNAQDVGFSGSLYVRADSTWRVKRADISMPRSSDINFVEGMRIIQDFSTLPDGGQVLTRDDMLVQLTLVDFLQKFQVVRTNEYTNFSFEPLPPAAFNFKGDTRTEPDAELRDAAFWQERRPARLSASEEKMDLFVKRLGQVRGFRPVLWVAKAFIENHVETSTDPARPSKIDIGPINTMISQNFVDGLRLRASAQTTANLMRHLFLKGYVAYGFKDHRWKGMGEVTYSFPPKAFLPREFPVNNLTFSYSRDVMSPSDKFLPTDKDNVFTSFKWTTVDHMLYYETFRLLWDREWANGLRFTSQLRTQKDEPTAALFYQPLDAAGAPSPSSAAWRKELRTTDLTLKLSYQPGTEWINTKQRRIATNSDAPIYSLSHTTGHYRTLGFNRLYNFTEASVYKRFWLNSWGKVNAELKGGVQWNRVPFPLLIMPAANLSYIKEEGNFSLIDNMEFLNDRYASLMLSWDLNGKLFNRIPLLRKLKWREFIGVNALWGTLSSKNNPLLEKNAGDGRLFYFPGKFQSDGTFSYLSQPMDSHRPYVEVMAGVHNIFKVLHVEYVRRLTYLSRPDTQKWGVRIMLRMRF